MFERYTEQARRALFFARYEATQMGSGAIDANHLLLGLIRDGHAVSILDDAGIPVDDLRTAIQDRAASHDNVATSSGSNSGHEMPFGAEATRVLELAASGADQLQHQHIGAEHLLLGIVLMESSVAASVLVERGLRPDMMRRLVVDANFGRGTTPGVRVVPTARSFEQGTSSRRELASWTVAGFYLKPLLAQLYEIAETRIELPHDLDPAVRYDCSVVLAPDEPFTAMNRLMQEGLEQHLQVTVTRETRATDVYILTAPGGSAPAITSSEDAGGGLGAVSFSVMDESDDPSRSEEELRATALERLKAMMAGTQRGPLPIERISGSVGVEYLCDILERSVNRPVIDETGLTGSLEWNVQVAGTTTDDLLAALRNQVGLLATPAHRDVTMLVVRRR